jgi:hypothetical protein
VSLRTEHRGYEISYSENADEWNCFDARSSAPTLSKLKAKIDALHLKIRKNAAVDGFEISSHGSLRLNPCRVIEYVGEKYSGGGWSNKPKQLVDHEVGCVAQRRGSERKSRSNTQLSRIAPVGPETDAAVAIAMEMEKKKNAAEAAYNEAVKAIPRMRIDDIQELIAASSERLSE